MATRDDCRAAGRRRGPRPAASRGFSLIELVVTVAIIAALAAVAVPSYTAYLVRGQRATAKAVLLQTAQTMERYFTANGSYVNKSAAFPLTGLDATPCVAVAPMDSGTANYCIVGAVANTNGFLLSAQPCGDAGTTCPAGANTSFVDSQCDVLQIDNTGLKSVQIGGVTQAQSVADMCWQK